MKYSLKRLWKNFNFLMKYNLEDFKIDILDEVEDICVCKDYYGADLKVLDGEETIDLLLKEPKSFCRIGDGEVMLMEGKSIPFQKYDKRLAESLLEILEEENNDMYVGIVHGVFVPCSKDDPIFNRRWHKAKAKRYREFFIKHCNHNMVYIDTAFNQKSATTAVYDFESYYRKIKALFSGRDLVIFSGKGVLDKLKYDVFELARSKVYLYGPSKNSFSEIDSLYKKALAFEPDKTLVFILGPCSKVLVSRLTKQGRIAFDAGHMAKDYDLYMKGTERSYDNIRDFYRPD